MIILVQINYSEDHSEKILPLGILSVGSALKKYGYNVELLNITEKEIASTARKIANAKPDYVGLSVMTGIQTAHSAELSKELKAIDKHLPILWGGIHPSLLPHQCLCEQYIDFVIIGEGEITTLEFTNALLSDKQFKEILGLGYKQDGQIIVNAKRPLIENLDDWRLDFSLLDMNKYVYRLDRYQRTIAYKASRGCPFGCAFCYNNEFNQNRWRAWSIETVVEDIEYLKNNFSIDAVKFYDDNFFVNKQRAYEILDRISLPSHLEIRIDMIDEDVAAALKKYRVYDLLIGLESGSDRMLKMIDKNFTVEKMLKGVRAIAKEDLRACYSFIVGLPTETEAEFNETIKAMYEVYKIHPRATFTLGAYLPYPGSKLYASSIEQGFTPPQSTEEWGKIDRFRKSFDSPWVNAKKVWIIRECYKLMGFDLLIFKKWFGWRIRKNYFKFPLDAHIVEYVSGIALEEKGIIGKTLRKIYNFLRFRK